MSFSIIDERFKDQKPEDTVKKIRAILQKIGININENWNDSGISNCFSLMICPDSKIPSANGKGTTKEFARASAYGEFIERLQQGLFFYKYQSIARDPTMNLHSYAPDKKYMTTQELVENGEWMDHIIKSLGSGLTREKIAKLCKIYACVENDEILCIPYYSLLEDKYIYLPVGFVEQIYSANGCCAGNTKEEAWIHAFSEIMERKCNIDIVSSGQPAPRIPEDVLYSYKTVASIMNQIKSQGDYDIHVYDFSNGTGYPVVSTRIISKKNHSYISNTAADPVFEIALHRTFTEIMQGRNIRKIDNIPCTNILNNISDFPLAHNILNLLETGNGLFTADSFGETASPKEFEPFKDRTTYSNKEILDEVLTYFKSLNKPIYVRNYSYLGFHSYKIIIPGFSESRGVYLTSMPQDYGIGDRVSKILKDVRTADEFDLNLLLNFHKHTKTTISRHRNFAYLSGIPIYGSTKSTLLFITLSYASYRLGKYEEAIKYIDSLLKIDLQDEVMQEYFECVRQFIVFKSRKYSDSKIRVILSNFFHCNIVEEFYSHIENNNNPYDPYLLYCDNSSCSRCRINNVCKYNSCKEIIKKAGEIYYESKDLQNKKFFN